MWFDMEVINKKNKGVFCLKKDKKFLKKNKKPVPWNKSHCCDKVPDESGSDRERVVC